MEENGLRSGQFLELFSRLLAQISRVIKVESKLRKKLLLEQFLEKVGIKTFV